MAQETEIEHDKQDGFSIENLDIFYSGKLDSFISVSSKGTCTTREGQFLVERSILTGDDVGRRIPPGIKPLF